MIVNDCNKGDVVTKNQLFIFQDNGQIKRKSEGSSLFFLHRISSYADFAINLNSNLGDCLAYKNFNNAGSSVGQTLVTVTTCKPNDPTQFWTVL